MFPIAHSSLIARWHRTGDPVGRERVAICSAQHNADLLAEAIGKPLEVAGP